MLLKKVDIYFIGNLNWIFILIIKMYSTAEFLLTKMSAKHTWCNKIFCKNFHQNYSNIFLCSTNFQFSQNFIHCFILRNRWHQCRILVYEELWVKWQFFTTPMNNYLQCPVPKSCTARYFEQSKLFDL